MRRKKKEASKVKQTNKAKQHGTPKTVTFPRKNELPQVGLEPLATELPRQLSWLGPNLTSHSTLDEQANHQRTSILPGQNSNYYYIVKQHFGLLPSFCRSENY